jgi:sec-independent protein translocase protein TatA
VAKGIKSFKKGMAEDEPAAPPPSASTADPKVIDHAQPANAATAKAETKA